MQSILPSVDQARRLNAIHRYLEAHVRTNQHITSSTDRFASGGSGPCANLSGYCSQYGTPYQAAIEQLDYIHSMGFNAVWISPVIENTEGGYHGYWAKDLYTMNPHFGSQQDLIQFVSECHKRDIWVMLDVVANHMGPVGYNYTGLSPFNEASDFHDCVSVCDNQCQITDYDCFTEAVQYCRLAGLPDLNQTVPYVRTTLLKWIAQLVTELGVDGLRVDTVPEVEKEFWAEFQAAAGVYAVGEVFSGDMNCLANYTQDGLDAVLSYPMFFTLRGVFQDQQSMNSLNSTLEQYRQSIADPSILGTFVDNHDNPRFLYQFNDTEAYRGALAWVMLAEGIPIIYYGTEQGFDGGDDPDNREVLWPSKYDLSAPLARYITVVLQHRTAQKLWLYPQIQRYSNDDSFYAFSRNQTLVALTNQQTYPVSRSICYNPYRMGQEVCNILKPATFDCATVDSNGCLHITLTNGEVKIYSPS
eukprot:TRINITY_DN2222_c0_g1_i1.p1 TRINITY_DN2222_c0_g1~~TRINITY_DN2222_c0_g1_i1.p1  ORF type:complete len:472 (-),score=54.80 TRINITY_DN2222_c0_g1_i1:48-1463(-)